MNAPETKPAELQVLYLCERGTARMDRLRAWSRFFKEHYSDGPEGCALNLMVIDKDDLLMIAKHLSNAARLHGYDWQVVIYENPGCIDPDKPKQKA